MFKRKYAILTATTPIAHADTLTGVGNSTNTRLFMRQGMIVNGNPTRTPAISENALRSTLLRAPLAHHLLSFLGIEKNSLPQAVANFIFSGGNLAPGAKAPSDENRVSTIVRSLYPSIELLSGSADSFILPRSRLKLSAWILCKEYKEIIKKIKPELESLCDVSVYDMVSEEVRTRGTGDNSQGNQMLYSYETLASSAKILIEFTTDLMTSKEADSAIAAGLSNWDGFIGGQSRQGRGRVSIDWLSSVDETPYLSHLEKNAEAMKAGLLDGTFGSGHQICKD